MIMVSDELYWALKRIERCDPDGDVVEPTTDAHAEHEAWAVATYGRDVWEVYRNGGWAEASVA